jgi:hypothetical protein
MIMRRKLRLRAVSADVLAAAALTLATLGAVSAYDPAHTATHVVLVADDEGLPGGGRPPAPGPTNPSQ